MQIDSSKSMSFFHGVRSRQLSSFPVRKQAWVDELASDFTEIGALENNVLETPPLAVSFCKASKSSHIFAVSDEAGYVNLFDSRRKLSSAPSHHENAEKARISDWLAHQNAIFDVCWIKEGTHILTASGDQTIKVWDTQDKKCTGVLMGHTGSVKCLNSHPTNSDLIVSGSRDGSFAIWDLRCKIDSNSRCDELCHQSTSTVKGAHPSTKARRGRTGKAAASSITSVIYLKDEISIATAGAADSVVKFWDIRNLKSNVTQACPQPKSSTQKGISSLSQDLRGVFLTASCMDNRIYLYNVLQLDKGPIRTFSVCRIESFYVKAAISPDGDHILSGSSDGNAYTWKVNKVQVEPLILKGHHGEVTVVEWCPSEMGMIATASDDFTVRLWNIEPRYCSSKKSSSSIRRRLTTMPTAESSKLFMNENEEPMTQIKQPGSPYSLDEALFQINPIPATASLFRTPEAQKRRFSSISDSDENFEKTPESATTSPSSVLNPPLSLKRKTIRDYFLAAQ
ncbi:hypothetical protein F3Y22_tig00112530pilonHSYRG00126 [Hibiscus syriacus]|uniref:Uncharacterized protein n=1 Tax=Hibiscus syriacus TaxID=106335 RepID=A0A6A2WWI0_HIBSY|nr:denticleless protein homolog [Hibiscus syriacus]KAE8665681.1 hypothetical protein F3Y22_tig00112530pilonHSYRG00126 [Hibiscus syriacus]